MPASLSPTQFLADLLHFEPFDNVTVIVDLPQKLQERHAFAAPPTLLVRLDVLNFVFVERRLQHDVQHRSLVPDLRHEFCRWS